MPAIKNTKNILSLLFIINLLIFKVSCDTCVCTDKENENDCSQCDNCKFFYVDKTCIECQPSLTQANPYYTKVDCQSVPKSGIGSTEYKLLYNTKEVVQGDCPTTGDYKYQLGNICYKNIDSDIMETDGNDYKYKCKNRFSIIKKDFDYYNCYTSDEECPSNFKYYDYASNQCLDSCDRTIKKEGNIYRCSDTCINDGENPEIEYDETGTQGIIRYCVTTCPSQAKYYYKPTEPSISSTQPYKCLEKCDNNHYSLNGVCVDSCNNNKKIVFDTEQPTYSCVDSCPKNFPYSYSYSSTGESPISYCLKSCEDSKNIDVGVDTYIFEKTVDGNIVKSCEANRPTGENNEQYYKDIKSLKWVTDCKLSPSGPYHDGNSCKESCSNYDCINSANFECISRGTNFIYEEDGGNKICYTECPQYTGKGFYRESDGKCISCSVSDGYYRANDKRCYNLSEIQETFSSNQYYVNEGDNFLFENGCNNPLYKYSKYETSNPNPIICYQSCFNITDTNYEKDYQCYETLSTEGLTNYYYFKIKEDFTKYTTNKEDCLKSGFPYLQDSQEEAPKECIKECDSSKYRILPKQNELGMCCSEASPGNCKTDNYKYYNDSSKIITDKCEGFIVVDIDGNLLTNGQNCLESCPNNYCEDIKNKRCFTECKNYYNEKVGNSEKKIYVEECNGFFYTENSVAVSSVTVKKCVEVCSKVDESTNKIVYTYYLEQTKECIDTCPKDPTTETGDYYSYDTKENHQPCLTQCSEYHYEGNNPKICVKECYEGDYYKSITDKICAKQCGNANYYILPGNICSSPPTDSSSPCPTSAPFINPITILGVTYKKCVANCDKYYKVDFPDDDKPEKECIDTCVGGYIYNEGCYASCPEGLYIDGNNCVSKCQKNFYKNDDGKYVCSNGCNNDYPLLTSSGECVKHCPLNENYIGSDNKCLSSCEKDTNKYFEEIVSNLDPPLDYNNYKCISKCSSSVNNNINIEGTKLCTSTCPDYLYENGDDKICYKTCISNQQKSFSTKSGENKICSDKCEINTEKNFYNDKVCVNGCSTSSNNNTINDCDYSCVKSCDLTSNCKYLQIQSNDDETLHCKRSCESSLSKRFLGSNYICIAKCEIPNNYVVEADGHQKKNECLSKCPDDMPFMRKNVDGEYLCSNNACLAEEYYYMNTSICLDSCGDSLYLYEIGTKKYCVNSCDFLKNETRYYYETTTETNKKQCISDCSITTDKQYTKLNGVCDNNCDNSEFYVDGEFTCMSKCPYGTKNTDGQICKKCEDQDTQYIDGNGNCIDDCANSNYIYHNKNEYQCIDSCNSDKFIEDNVCKNACENKLFIDNKNCLDKCPPNKRFHVEAVSYTNKTCIYDCPDSYKFYTISEDGDHFPCTDSCSAYIPNPKMKAQYCLGANCIEPDLFFIKDQDNKKMCYSQCPSSHPYYVKEGENEKHCYEECPDNYIHLPDDFECILYSECKTPKKIKYSIKQCIEQCSKNDKIFEKNSDLTFCLNDCDNITLSMRGGAETDTLKRTNDNKCVFECPQNSTQQNNECICTRLFYYDKSTGYKSCLNADLTLCETIKNYPIIKMNQNQCTDYCDGVLSLSGFECYNSSYTCEKNQTLITLINGNKKCECKNKYYHVTENNRKIRKCLAEKEECPSSYPYLIKETNECIKKCSDDEKYKIILGKTCVETCPTSTHEENVGEEEEGVKECKCDNKWYISDNNDVICIKDDGECPSDKELYVESTKQCVSSCIGTDSEVYYKKTCIKSCGEISNTELEDSRKEPKLKLISKNFCKCKNLWYYDINGYEVCTEMGTDKPCKNLGDEGYSFKYVIYSINQCTNKCPDEYPYLFDDRCISSCTSAGLIIDNEESKTCKCPNLWRYNQNEKMECLNDNQCGGNELLIYSTKQCLLSCSGESCTPECPKESPLLYQNTCYKSNECPKNTKYDEINQKCACEFKWYKVNVLEYCLTNNTDCPDGYPYVFYETNECKKDKDDLFEVNNTLYKYCPENTTPNNDRKECECDPLAGYWYQKTENGKTITVCGLNECSGNYPYHNFQEKECYPLCNDNYFLYENTCYNEKCPNLTEIIPGTKECKLKEVDTEIKINDLEKVMTDNIVDLYQRSSEASGTNKGSGAVASASKKIVTTGATVEFYGVNKNNRGNSHQDVKSDLSYIDISECIEKIYKSNNMNEKEDDIIILKFDVNREFQNYLITPVEYKFINSRTGRELDASVCEHNSIRISYPVHNLINKYDKMRKKLRLLEYMKVNLMSNNKDSLREKFDKGIDIIADYPDTDIFNINDKFYSDICIAVEVNGKDLVLEDRIKFFYPQLSLCENNCTYNRTDFTNERIHCDCSYKTEFDFERKYTDSFELNANETTKNQKSKSNIEVLKCISNLNDSKSLSKNGGFIYSLIIMIVEAIILLVIILIGIHSLSLKLTNKINKTDENPEKIEVNVINTNDNKKTYEDIKSSERNIDNPPKKKVGDFKIEFIPQEYVFLFFSHGEKGIVKKVEKDSVPFKIQYNTRVLLEQKKGVNYDNINPRGPFPQGQNVLVVVDSMDDDINDYIGEDDENGEGVNNKKGLIDANKNRSNNTSRKSGRKRDEKDGYDINDKLSKPRLYKKADQFTVSDYDPSDENYSIYDIEEELDEDEDGDGDGEHHERGFIETLKKNQRLLNRNYEIAMQNKNTNFVEILFTEIIDKIYITKILFFTRKFDIFWLQLSVYLLCHLLLLVLNTLFYDIDIIKKIWNEENYPGLGYHLGYGFAACLIIWIVYKIFLCLLTNNDKIKDLLKMIHYNDKFGWNKGKEIDRKFKNLMWKVKFKVV